MKAMFDLGTESVKCGRYDTLAPMFLCDVIAMMRQENGAGDAVYRLPGRWPALRQMFDGYLAAPPKGLQVPWVTTRRAAYAWRCGEYAEAKRTLDTLGEKVEPQAFGFFAVEYSQVRDECHARSGPVANEIKKLDVQETLRRCAAAADGYDKLVAGMAKDDLSRPYCARRRIVDRMAASLVEGKPAEVPMNDPDAVAAWRGDTADWKLVDGMLANTWHTLTMHCNTEDITVEHDGQVVIKAAQNIWFGHGKATPGRRAHSGPGETSVRVRRIVIEPGE